MFNRFACFWPKGYQPGSLGKSHQNGNYLKQAMRKKKKKKKEISLFTLIAKIFKTRYQTKYSLMVRGYFCSCIRSCESLVTSFSLAKLLGSIVTYNSSKNTDPIHLPKKHLPKISFPLKTLGRDYIIPNVHFPERAFARNYNSLNVHLPEITFPRKLICQNLHLSEFTFGRM